MTKVEMIANALRNTLTTRRELYTMSSEQLHIIDDAIKALDQNKTIAELNLIANKVAEILNITVKELMKPGLAESSIHDWPLMEDEELAACNRRISDLNINSRML